MRAILSLSKEGDKVENGLLPKPFGGMAKAAQSKGISNDQYEHALFALWSFRRVCPDWPLIGEIESAIVRWTDYFLRKGFAYVFHGRHWVSLQIRGDEKLPVSIVRHVLGLYLPMCLMCGRITGDSKYTSLAEQTLLPRLHEWTAQPRRHFTCGFPTRKGRVRPPRPTLGRYASASGRRSHGERRSG